MVNWLEDLAARYELDLLAINEKEFVMVDLQTYVGERGSKKNEALELKDSKPMINS